MRILIFPRNIRCSDNPYGELLYRDMPSFGVEVHGFSIWQALWGRYDVFHLHWPEYYLNRSLLKALFGSLLVLLSTVWLRARGTRILWTVHNPHSHSHAHPTMEAWFWEIFTRMLDGFVSLSDSCSKWIETDIPHLRRTKSSVIPHGHYRQAYPATIDPIRARDAMGIAPAQTVLLFFGGVSSYKNVPHLINTFRDASLPDTIMLISGRPQRRHRPLVETAAGTDRRIKLDLRRIPTNEVQLLFSAADLVVLPFSDIMHSGSAMLALSFDRPVLVPARGSLPELQMRVGSEWVRTYDGELTAAILKDAAAWAKAANRDSRPDLSCFDWPQIVEATIELYSRLCSQPLPLQSPSQQPANVEHVAMLKHLPPA
jgi:beta-1,4-mannosyltransferase